jgi:hypothetical protein
VRNRLVNNPENYRLERHSGEAGLKRLFDDWADLVARLDHPSPSHFPHWYRAFLRRPDARGTIAEFIAIYDGDVLAAVFPFGVERFRRFDLVQLSIPINIDLNSVPDIVVGANQDHGALFEFFLRHAESSSNLEWDVLVVGKTLADSNIAKCIESSKRFTTAQRFAGHCCHFNVDGSEEGIPGLSKKLRSRLRNARNRLQSAGAFEFEVVTDPVSAMAAFAEFADLEITGWKARRHHGKPGYNHGQAIALDVSKHGFYRDVVAAFAEGGHVEMFRLNLNGRPIAVLIAVVLGGTCYLLRMAYDDNHARLSPGFQLFDFVMQQNLANPLVNSVTLFSDFAWMDAWQPLRRDYVSYRYFNSTIAGSIYGTAMRIKGAMAPVYRRLRGVSS